MQLEKHKLVDDRLDLAKLRNRAEQECIQHVNADMLSSRSDEKKLLHELQVYRIELEMQNEALQKALTLADEARAEAEHAKECYVKLFDFAPIAYFILDKDSIIQKTNLLGAKILGDDREKLIGQQFNYYLDSENWPIFQRLLRKRYFIVKIHRLVRLKYKGLSWLAT